MKKRFLAVLMALVLAFSAFTGFAPVEAEYALTEEKMKEVLIAVKGKLDIPDEFTEFDYSFNEYTGEGRYYFNWSNEDGNERISVNADANGRIFSYSRYDYSSSSANEGKMPTYIGEELLPKAEEWIYRVEPKLKGKLDLKRCSYSAYNKRYSFGFVRIENGIDMNDNSVSITMDAFNAKVMSYSLNWNFEVSIPKVTAPITKEAAASLAGEKVGMQLEYRLTYDKDGKEKVFLAYNPDRTYIAIDAKTGKAYLEKNYWGSGTDFDEGFNDAEMTAAENSEDSYSYNGKSVRLSDAEIKKIGDIKDIITAEQAVNLIKNNKRLYIDPNLNKVTSRLYNNDGEYYWNLSLSDDRPVDYSKDYNYRDYYRASASAQINAKTGKLIRFSATTKDYYDYTNEGSDKFVANFTSSQCKKLFEEFIKETDKDKADYVKKTNEYDRKVTIYYNDSRKDYDKVGGYSYTYGRYYKDIPFSANYISGAVEATTGKVTNYYVNWTDAKLPEPKNLIGEKKAFESYIACDGFDLIYELVNKYDNSDKYYGVEKEVKARLVYRTAISPNFIDAFTGKRVDWSGEEYKPAGVSYKYTDIAGTKYERSIKLLADMGLGFDGEEFKPAQKITNEEFEKLLAGNYSPYVRYYINDVAEEEDEADDPDELIPDDETKVTREEACALIIKALGGEKFAQMDIFKTGYSDEKKIKKENIGAVALCKGLEIMGAKSGKKFKPASAITRGEAADLVIRMMSADF